ncbi:hypothetical protein Dimus_029018 [Dionaea muscipula]
MHVVLPKYTRPECVGISHDLKSYLVFLIVFSMYFVLFRERDTDKDEKVNFNKFFHGLFDLVRNYDDEGHNSSSHLDDSGEAPTSSSVSLYHYCEFRRSGGNHVKG